MSDKQEEALRKVLPSEYFCPACGSANTMSNLSRLGKGICRACLICQHEWAYEPPSKHVTMTDQEFKALERKLFPEYFTWHYKFSEWWDAFTTFCGYCVVAVLAAGVIALLLENPTFLAVFLALLGIASGFFVFLPEDAREAKNVKVAVWGFLYLLLFLAWELTPVVEVLNLPRCSETVKTSCRP